jgi:hypothetical protein
LDSKLSNFKSFHSSLDSTQLQISLDTMIIIFIFIGPNFKSSHSSLETYIVRLLCVFSHIEYLNEFQAFVVGFKKFQIFVGQNFYYIYIHWTQLQIVAFVVGNIYCAFIFIGPNFKSSHSSLETYIVRLLCVFSHIEYLNEFQAFVVGNNIHVYTWRCPS